ncbi:DUF1178 family protein [Minwuia sp.]|uniref:DUF1178 family protein n=1 Tax=Minwuia sp. TaxID=2493630 RepID=UPI003A93BBB4
MISFDLKCGQEHVFEGWFSSNQDFLDQNERGLVTCPMCNDDKIIKAPMAPNVASKGDASSAPEISPAQMMVMLKQMRQHVEKNAEYVGPAFAEEARKIHYGETEVRDIYGESTPDETEALRDEGIEFAQIPWVRDAEH